MNNGFFLICVGVGMAMATLAYMSTGPGLLLQGLLFLTGTVLMLLSFSGDDTE